jgi:uncharacterized protein (TIGR02145 family)
LTIAGTTLTISDGNSVSLPEGFSGDYNDLTNKPTNVSTLNNDAGYLTRDSLGDCTCLTAVQLQALLDRIAALEQAVGSGNGGGDNEGGDDNPDDNNTTITAQACPGTPTVIDVDGNVYNTVQIGDQCWMRENLRTTRYAHGTTTIPLGTTTSSTTAYRYYPDNDSANVSTYGYLYNWRAVMAYASSSEANPSGVQGICPYGWHVPSDDEWTELTNYVSSQSLYVCGDNTNYIAKVLASREGWHFYSGEVCNVGNNPSTNNATGFSARPAGGYISGSNYGYFGDVTFFWSATQGNSDGAYSRFLFSTFAFVGRDNYGKNRGYSVRCVRD